MANLGVGTSTTGNMMGGNMDMLKSQILTMFAITGANKGDNTGIFNAIYAIIMITILENVFRYLPVMIKWFADMAKSYIDGKVKQLPVTISNSISNGVANTEVSIYLCRNYENNGGGSSGNGKNDKSLDVVDTEVVDAMIEYICSLDNTGHLRYTNKFFINCRDEIVVNKDITALLDKMDIDVKNDTVNAIGIRLKSKTLKLSQLKDFVMKVLNNWKIEKQNKLGSQRY